MAVSARKHTVPAEGETPRFQAINELAASINDYVPVANTTERAQVVADLGWVPSPARPLLVFRADAPAHSPFEVTTDGTTWRILGLHTAAVDLSSGFTTGWSSYGSGFGILTLSSTGPSVRVNSGLVRRASAPASVVAGQEYGLCAAGTIPVGLRPSAIIPGTGLLTASTNVTVTVRVQPDGGITYVPIAGATLTPPNHFLTVNTIPWDVPIA